MLLWAEVCSSYETRVLTSPGVALDLPFDPRNDPAPLRCSEAITCPRLPLRGPEGVPYPTPFGPQAPSLQRSSAVREAPKTPPAQPVSECRTAPSPLPTFPAWVLKVFQSSHAWGLWAVVPASLGRSETKLCLPSGPCPLQSRRDNKTNNFLGLYLGRPFILPVPRGRTDLVVGPVWQLRCHWGLGRPARLGRAGPGSSRPAAPPSPAPAPRYCLVSSSLFPLLPFSAVWLLLLSSGIPVLSPPSSWLLLSITLPPPSPPSQALSPLLPPS